MSKTIVTAAAATYFETFGLDALNTELTARGLGEQEDSKVGSMLVATGVRTLDEFAATLINLSEGSVTSENLERAFHKAFPEHKIGDRHGAHYLSLARNGNLSGTVECRFKPEKAVRKKAASSKGIDLDVSSMDDDQREALAVALEGSQPETAAAIRAFGDTSESADSDGSE